MLKIFKTHKLPEGDYLAKINDVRIVYEGKKCPKIVFYYVMQNIETGDFESHQETLVGDFNLLRCRDLMFFWNVTLLIILILLTLLALYLR